MKIGFIGFGNMARAIAGGIVKLSLVPGKEICIFDISEDARETAKEFGFTVLSSEKDVVENSEYVFLCVKPQTFSSLLERIKTVIQPQNIFLTIAAGIQIDSITAQLGNVPVIRAMPNTPLLVGSGATALTHNAEVSDEKFAFLKDVFASVGSVYELPEEKFNEIINVNGSSPAYLYLFAKIISEYAIADGIPPEIALPMFCDTMVGSAKMLTEAGKTPDELIAMVSSKGGTTVAALQKFEESGFKESLQAGLKACVDRAYEISL